MDTLSIPVGTLGENLLVSADEWDNSPAVEFNLPMDGRVVSRDQVPSLIEWLQGFLEETGPPLPTLPHATIKARLKPDGTERVLALVEPYQEPSWVSYDEGHSADWFESEAIASFEVLFPGFEA